MATEADDKERGGLTRLFFQAVSVVAPSAAPSSRRPGMRLARFDFSNPVALGHMIVDTLSGTAKGSSWDTLVQKIKIARADGVLTASVLDEALHHATIYALDTLSSWETDQFITAIHKTGWNYGRERQEEIVRAAIRRAGESSSFENLLKIIKRCRDNFSRVYYDIEDEIDAAWTLQTDKFLRQLEKRKRPDTGLLSRILKNTPEGYSNYTSLTGLLHHAIQHDLFEDVKHALIKVQSVADVFKDHMSAEDMHKLALYYLRPESMRSDHRVYKILALNGAEKLHSYAANLNRLRDNLSQDIFLEVWPEIQKELLDDEIRRGLISLASLIEDMHPGVSFIKARLGHTVDTLLKKGKADRALTLATSAKLDEIMGGDDLLTGPRIEKFAAVFRETGSNVSAAWFAAYIAKNHPQYYSTVEDLAPATDDPAQILGALSPIITGYNTGDIRRFAEYLSTVPFADVAAAQIDMLSPLWDAMGAADTGIVSDLTHGRADVPMTADGLRDLSRKVTQMLNVVQTQAPVIMPSEMYNNFDIKEHVPKDYPGAQSLDQGFSLISGSNITILHVPGTANAESDTKFGFLSVSRTESMRAHDRRFLNSELIAMPVMTIDDDIFKRTIRHNGEGILRAFQTMIGIINHDYFHHFTGRIINPYFSLMQGGISLQDTPYGVLMGKSQTQLRAQPIERSNGQWDFNKNSGFGMEQYNRYYYETYHDDGDWPTFAEDNANYEYHALRLHSALYRQHMDDGPAGLTMRASIDSYMSGVAAVGERMAKKYSDESVNHFKCYYACLLGFHLRRIVPFDHPLMAYAESRIDDLGISPAYMHASILTRAAKTIEGGFDTRVSNVRAISGVDERNESLTVAQAVRWNTALSSVGVLNLLYAEKYALANEKALPALRQTLSVVARDMAALDYRGGYDAFLQYKAQKARQASEDMLPVAIPHGDSGAKPSAGRGKPAP